MTPTEEIIERIGLRFEEDGLPRIAGRMMGLLLLSSQGHSLDELGEQLRVSRSSASTNARLLERMRVVERSSRPGDRRDYYRLVDDLHVRMLNARLERMQATRDLLAEALSGDAACGDERVEARLETLVSFFSDALGAMETARQRWLQEQQTRPDT